MGACNCREEERVEYGNLYTSENTFYKPKSLKKVSSFKSIKLAKETPNPVNENQNVLEISQEKEHYHRDQPEESKSIKMIQYQTKEEELPYSIYASVERDDSIKIEQLQPAQSEEIKAISVKNDSSISIKEDSIKDDVSIILTFDQEYEYDEFSNNVFNIYNNLRTSPEKFVNCYDKSKIISLII